MKSKDNQIDKKDGGDRLAGLSPAVSGPPGPTVLQFRRATVPPSPAAEVSPPETSAPFESLGPIVQAVVMRLKEDRVRIRVVGPGREGDAEADGDGPRG